MEVVNKEHVQATVAPRVFYMTQYVDGPLLGPFDDWPANIQDPILAAMDKLSAKHKIPLAIIGAMCDKDIDLSTKDKTWYYVHVEVSEIVATPKFGIPIV